MSPASIDSDGWLAAAWRRPSPNFDPRPEEAVIELVVVHGISLPPGVFGGDAVTRLFCNTLDCAEHPDYAALAGLRVSAHALVDRGGETTQYVSFLDRAWHAGPSRFAGRTQCNDFSIGIELEGTDTTPYEPRQYEALVAIVHALMQRWPAIGPDRIVGHADIAPGRKTDPGEAFDWSLLREMLAAV